MKELNIFATSTLLSKLVEVHPMGQKFLRSGELGWRVTASLPLENRLKMGLNGTSKTYGAVQGSV